MSFPILVRKGGFEPPRLSAPPPQDGVSASSTTSALASQTSKPMCALKRWMGEEFSLYQRPGCPAAGAGEARENRVSPSTDPLHKPGTSEKRGHHLSTRAAAAFTTMAMVFSPKWSSAWIA